VMGYAMGYLCAVMGYKIRDGVLLRCPSLTAV